MSNAYLRYRKQNCRRSSSNKCCRFGFITTCVLNCLEKILKYICILYHSLLKIILLLVILNHIFDRMTLFKIAAEFSWNIIALRKLNYNELVYGSFGLLFSRTAENCQFGFAGWCCIFGKRQVYCAGTHFTNDSSITIQIRWKFHLALIQLLVLISQQNLAHATTAQLSCHVPNLVAITL